VLSGYYEQILVSLVISFSSSDEYSAIPCDHFTVPIFHNSENREISMRALLLILHFVSIESTKIESTGDEGNQGTGAVPVTDSEVHHDGRDSYYEYHDEYDEYNGSDVDDHFMEEWESVMNDFEPELLVTVPIGSRSDEFFYEDVTVKGTTIRGAYFIIGSESENTHTGVDFVITDPNGQIIYQRNDQVEGVFRIEANTTGTYTVMLSNHKWMTSKQVTLLMGTGEQKTLKTKDLSSLQDGIGYIENALREIHSESSYLWIKQKSHMRAVSTINTRVFWYHLIQFLIIVAVSSVQIYYIRGLISNRRMF